MILRARRFASARVCALISVACVQSRAKRTLADGREVSAFWGGSLNPNGSKKRSKLAAPEATAKQKAAEQQRTARKADLRRRLQVHRAVLGGLSGDIEITVRYTLEPRSQ